MAASVRTELMGVTAAAAAAAVAVAVVAASINLPNLHASLPFPPSLSLCFSAGAVQKNCIKSLCIFEGIRGGLQHLKFGISTFTACGFPRSQKKAKWGTVTTVNQPVCTVVIASRARVNVFGKVVRTLLGIVGTANVRN